MTPFAKWIAAEGVTQKQAAHNLGISRTMVQDLCRGHRIDNRTGNPRIDISRTLGLAMAAYSFGLSPQG